MKKCNEILTKNFGGSTPKIDGKCNATLAKTQKGGEKLTEKSKAGLFFFVGFHLNLTENCNENFGKDRFTLDPTIPIFVVTLG